MRSATTGMRLATRLRSKHVVCSSNDGISSMGVVVINVRMHCYNGDIDCCAQSKRLSRVIGL
jgi:hypothetical protein